MEEDTIEMADEFGSDEGDVAPASEFTPEEIAAFEAADERDALAALFAHVRTCSTDGRLSVPYEWADEGIVPDHMSAEDFEMLVYEYLEERRAEREAEDEPQKSPVCRTATRAVGVPRPFAAVADGGRAGDGDEGEGEAADGDEGRRRDGADDSPDSGGRADSTAPDDGAADGSDGGSVDGLVASSVDGLDDNLSGFDVPEGFELVELEGEMTLVPLAEEDDSDEIACDDIVVLMGKQRYYLYSKDIMTERYAHWAFLACEDDRIVTFVECVREESRTYPRPMATDSLLNEPFSMTEDEVAETWSAISESGEYPDIETTTASNGDVYFYSTEHLSPAYAASLAEWHAVERGMYL